MKQDIYSQNRNIVRFFLDFPSLLGKRIVFVLRLVSRFLYFDGLSLRAFYVVDPSPLHSDSSSFFACLVLIGVYLFPSWISHMFFRHFVFSRSSWSLSPSIFVSLCSDFSHISVVTSPGEKVKVKLTIGVKASTDRNMIIALNKRIKRLNQIHSLLLSGNPQNLPSLLRFRDFKVIQSASREEYPSRYGKSIISA